MSISIQDFFDSETSTFTYVISDLNTNKTAIIDPVLGFDQFSGRTNTVSADSIINFIRQNNLILECILETHIHADHLTGSSYIKEKLGGKICVGSKIKDVLKFWIPIFNISHDTTNDGSQFDLLLEDKQEIALGDSKIRVMHTPGHTPACASYLIENNIFVGDTIFLPDLGTARADFPGGSAETLYNSIQQIFSLDPDTKIYHCHDYPPEGREKKFASNIDEQINKNVMINKNILKNEYVEMRNARDKTLSVPKLLLPSIQFNLRAGSFGNFEDNQKQYIKIPINVI